MTLAIIGVILGAIVGLMRARANKGNRLDQLQYMAVFAIAGGILGMIVAVVLVRAF